MDHGRVFGERAESEVGCVREVEEQVSAFEKARPHRSCQRRNGRPTNGFISSSATCRRPSAASRWRSWTRPSRSARAVTRRDPARVAAQRDRQGYEPGGMTPGEVPAAQGRRKFLKPLYQSSPRRRRGGAREADLREGPSALPRRLVPTMIRSWLKASAIALTSVGRRAASAAEVAGGAVQRPLIRLRHTFSPLRREKGAGDLATRVRERVRFLEFYEAFLSAPLPRLR